MKKIINWFFNLFGYQIVKSASGLPPSQLMFSNFSNLSMAYEYLIRKIDGINLPKNNSRISLLARLRGTPPAEAYFIIMALFQSQAVNGDVCEFGVAQGETSALIANELLASHKKFHLFDSFQGLSDPTPEDELKDDIFALGSMPAYKGKMSFHKKMVISRLRAVDFPNARYTLHAGFIEDLISTEINLPQKISFAYVDFDLYAPIKTTLDFLHGRTETGAIIIVDDYDYFSTGVKKAVDEFIQGNSEYQIEVPNVNFGHFAILRKNNIDITAGK